MIYSGISQEPRANLLLGQVETRYLQFIDQLPASMQRIALSKETYLGGSSQEPFSGLQEMNPLITRIPWLFWEVSNNLGDETFLVIAEAGACMALASVLIDHLVDGQIPEPGPQILLREAIHDHALTQYRQVFTNNSNFWSHYERLSREHITCLELESEIQLKPHLSTYDKFKEYAGGKVAPMIITIAALGESLNIEDSLQPIESSIRYTSIAGQIHDDILDWESDLEERHLTYFLTSMVGCEFFEEGTWPDHVELEKVNNEDWLDVKSFDLALEWFDRALKEVNGIQCSGWKNYLHEYRAVAEKHQQNALTRHLIRVLSSD